ncbi:MAG: hypothetical protein JWO66_225 [Candidatus Eremiobacteraeota bacterium]|nr:hypothetical protein [Candidatus Eremiobacteraeota bacterium]
MTEDAAHYIFFSTLAVCGTVLALVFLTMRARARRRIPEPVLRTPSETLRLGPPSSRPGFTPRVVLTIAGVAIMIPELLLPVVGEIVDAGIAALLAYSWYTFFKQPRALVSRARALPLGVDECVRCHGAGFVDGAIDPLCGGKGWVSAPNRPEE